MVTSTFAWNWPIQRSWLQAWVNGRLRYECVLLGLLTIANLWTLGYSIWAQSGELNALLTQALARAEFSPPAAISEKVGFAQSLEAPYGISPVMVR